MPWEREAFAKVTISPKQLDEAFMGGCQSILDAKLEGYSEESGFQEEERLKLFPNKFIN